MSTKYVRSIVLLLSAVASACGGPALVASPEVTVIARGTIPSEPVADAWQQAPIHVAPLILQDMVEPRLMQASTAEVRVQAATDGRELSFRLEWVDPTRDDLPVAGRFSDACAVQMPGKSGPDMPAPQMGESGRPVEISYWRASWQAVVDGRGDSIKEIYPNASVDHYPFEAASLPEGSAERKAMAERYAPARTLGNHMAGPRDRPVQDLVATGPGTIQPAPETRSQGHGTRTKDGWAVVVRRPLPAGFTADARFQVAFAVWEGSHAEAGARKMRTGWIQMAMEPTR